MVHDLDHSRHRGNNIYDHLCGRLAVEVAGEGDDSIADLGADFSGSSQVKFASTSLS